jgi:hypothetical protein
MLRFARVGIGTAMFAAVCWSGGARAETDDAERATARAAAQRGILAVIEGRYSEGVSLLERAESMVHAPTHLLYLARAHEKMGKLVRARETYLKLVKEELKPSAPKPFRDAQSAGTAELAKLEPRIPSITIQVEAAELAQVIVSENDVPLSPGMLGIARPADPGAHKYTASAEGFDTVTKTVTLNEGASEIVVLKLRRSLAAGSAGASEKRELAAGSVEGAATGDGGSIRTWGYVALGASVAGAGVGTYFLVQSMREQSSADDWFAECKPNCPPDQQSKIRRMDDTAARQRTGAVIGFAAGGALLAAGLTMLFVVPDDDAAKVGMRPWVSPTSAGVAGRF